MQPVLRFPSPGLKCLFHIPFPCVWLAPGARVGTGRAVVPWPVWQILKSAVALEPERWSCFLGSETGDGNESSVYPGRVI